MGNFSKPEEIKFFGCATKKNFINGLIPFVTTTGKLIFTEKQTNKQSNRFFSEF